MMYDLLIVGGGPSGLSAALALGRARKRVLLCDSGPRRNAAAEQIHNFVTRDGTPPNEFRRIAREQLATYDTIEIEDTRVKSIAGERGAFRVELEARTVDARRVLLCTGMIDEKLPIEGFAELWGHSIVQCPYCHGWEARDRRWGFVLSAKPHAVMFALKLRAWTRDVTVFTNGVVELADTERDQLRTANIRVETAPIARLVGAAGTIEGVTLANGTTVGCDLLFAHPPQRQVPLVESLGLELDENGYVKVEPMKRETSRAGIYAAGDLMTQQQGAIFAAAAGTAAAAAINMDVTVEQVLAGAL
jgi:thioredoxin reductase